MDFPSVYILGNILLDTSPYSGVDEYDRFAIRLLYYYRVNDVAGILGLGKPTGRLWGFPHPKGGGICEGAKNLQFFSEKKHVLVPCIIMLFKV